MASIAESGLFPPTINAYLPAFNIETVKNNGLNIQFNLSEYNTASDIKSVHVSITRQLNYNSAFTNSYPLGIWVGDFTRPQSDNNAVINIPFTALNINKEINYNEYYKVQVRLSKGTNPHLTGTELSNYLTNENNLLQFSEWSTVCLIRFIAPSTFSLDCNGITLTDSETVINSSFLTISGIYEKIKTNGMNTLPEHLKTVKNDLEYLSFYTLSVLDTNDNILFASPEQEVNIHNLNIVNYAIPFYFEHNERYKIRLNYTTANLYSNQIDYPIRAVYPRNSWNTEGNDINEVTSIDTVIGKININFVSREEGAAIPQGSKITVRRSSDINSFTIWEVIWSKTVKENETILNFDDFTIESGVLYKYEITYTNLEDETYFIVEGPIMSIFDHAFLTGEGTQLCVKFNPNISSFKRNVSDNSINTIGGIYPFITRNGAMDYRTFTLSGTIAYEMDSEHQFSSRSDIYGEWINVYGSYFVNHYFNQRNDRITQRKFREIVLDYLYDDMPKLFRSTPEGNILVRITDVSLTPNQQLSRMVYDFSCTATEIGDATIENYKLYEIQDFGDE